MQEKAQMNEQLQLARRHVADFFQQRQDPRLPWRQERLSERIAELAEELGHSDAADPQAIHDAVLAAWFYPLGYYFDPQQPTDGARRALSAFGAPEAAELYRQLAAPHTPAAALLADAVAIATWLDEGAAELQLLEKELSSHAGATPDRTEWAQWRLQNLLNFRFASQAGRRLYQPLLSRRIQEYKNRLEKWVRSAADTPAAALPESEVEFADLNESPPIRLAQTYFRTVFRNHIHLSAIADNKAHIMISVNAILISVLISFASYRNLAETKPMVLLPVVIFLVTGLASLIAAVLSARPRVTALNSGPAAPADPAQQRRNLAFFGNFAGLSEARFLQLLSENLRDGSLLYGNLARDLYHLGRVLDHKYRYLSVAYNIFMVGLVATVVAFLAALWLG
jgi:hypothetical protein